MEPGPRSKMITPVDVALKRGFSVGPSPHYNAFAMRPSHFKKPLEFAAFWSSLMALVAAASWGSGPLGPGRLYTTVERMQAGHLRAVHDDRMRIAGARHEVSDKTGYTDYRAVLHVHASDSPHTGGTRPELLSAAHEAGVNIIMLNDHTGSDRDFINDSWRGLREGVLFIPGAESEGFLVYPVSSIKGRKWASREEYVQIVKERGGNIFLSHVEEKLDWPVKGLDGIEIYNNHTDVKDETAFYAWLRQNMVEPEGLHSLESALRDYPQEVFGVCQDYLSEIMAKWDRELATSHLTGVAANDCHHNQVFTLTAVDSNTAELQYISSRPTAVRITSKDAPGIADIVRGHRSGETIARLDFDPYDRSFRYVTTHILAKRLEEHEVRDALSRGHCYVAHDWLCDPAGFYFAAQNNSGKTIGIMGDLVKLDGSVVLKAALPVPCLIRVILDGELLNETKGDSLRISVRRPGVYRMEALLTIDGEQRPWIYSNPIYVRRD